MSTLPGALPSLSLSSTPTPLPGPGSAVDSQHLPPHHRRDHPLSIFHLPNTPAPALMVKTKVCMRGSVYEGGDQTEWL